MIYPYVPYVLPQGMWNTLGRYGGISPSKTKINHTHLPALCLKGAQITDRRTGDRYGQNLIWLNCLGVQQEGRQQQAENLERDYELTLCLYILACKTNHTE